MGLKIKKTFENGVVANDCYAKIADATYISGQQKILSVNFWFNKEARDSCCEKIITKQYPVSLESDDRTDFYTYLKTLTEFSEAEDL